MAGLLQNVAKFAVLAKRESEFTDDKTGKVNHFEYITGFDCGTAAVFTDLRVDDNSDIKYKDIQENAIYDVTYQTRIVNGSKNTVSTSSAGFLAHVGTLGITWNKK